MALRIKEKLFNTTVKALSQSLDIKFMTHLARIIDPTYNLHKRMNLPEGCAIPNQDAAKQIVRDMRDWNYFPEFIKQIIHASEKGFHGKKHSIPYVRDILKIMAEEGLSFDHQRFFFTENPQISRSHNWGILREGDSYAFTLLKLDFVKNSETLRKNPEDLVKKCFRILKEEFRDIVEFHQGRMWLWEGDGGLFAFHYQGRNRSAVCAAMEIQHRLFLFNHFRNPLIVPIELRISLLSRHCEYWSKKAEIRQTESFKAVEKQESLWTPAGGVTITGEILSHLDERLSCMFQRTPREDGEPIYQYRLIWEDM